MLHEHRVLTTAQVTQLAFGTTRAATARMTTLYQYRAVDRFRPLAPAGSSPLHFILDEAGAMLLAAEDGITPADLGYRRDRVHGDRPVPPPRPRHRRERDLHRAWPPPPAPAAGRPALECWWGERRCAAAWGDHARPDGYGRWPEQLPGQPAAVADFFLEYDTGTEPLTRLIAKLAGYAALAARTGITTPVLFWLPSPRREAALHARLAGPPPPGTPDAASAAQIPGVPVATAAPGTSPRRPGRGGLAARRQPRPAAAARPARPARHRPGPAAARTARDRAARPAAWPGTRRTPPRPPGTPCPASPAPARTAMTSRAARAGRPRLLAAAGLLCGGCSLLPHPAASPAAPASTTARPAATASPQPRQRRVPLASLLPFRPARLQAAAALAGRFTAAWDSWSWRQPPAAWLAALQPMAAASLEPALAQAAGDRGVLAQRTAARQVAVATVTALAIRDLTPGSVTVTVTAAQVITSSSGTSRTTAALGGHPHPRRRRLAGVGHRARRRGQLLKAALPDAASGRRARLGHRHRRHRRRGAAPAHRRHRRRGRRDHRAGSLRLHRPARRQQRRRLHPRELPRRLQGSRDRVRHPVDRPGRHRRRSKAATAPNDGPSSAGALGPMQFEPSTWALYGDGGNIMNPGDAIPAAARLLVANGAPGNLQQALFAYNHSSSYVTERPGPGRPLRRRRRPGHLRRRQRRLPAGRPRPAARRHRREDPRLRRGPARQALHLRGDRARTPSTARAWP